MTVNKISYDILNLSSGTIANASGLRKYDEIEEFQNRFFNWVVIYNPEYTDWKKALLLFMSAETN
jgi:hypothetical protein